MFLMSTTNLWSLIQNVLNSQHYNYALIYNTIVVLYILYIYIIYHKS